MAELCIQCNQKAALNKGLCTSCRVWTERLEFQNNLTIADGICYESVFPGSLINASAYTVELLHPTANGTKTIHAVLKRIGPVPQHFRTKFKDTAKAVRAQVLPA